MANFWGNESKLDFHQAVADLQDLTRYPVGEEYYRHREGSESDTHVFKFKDELQLADDLAFLANSEEGVGTVSAVTIQEESDGITVLLASNYTPTEKIMNGLRNILSIIQKYAVKVRNRQRVYQKLLDQVIGLCRDRILQRIRPPWWGLPEYNTKERSFLLSQLQDFREQNKEESENTPEIQTLFEKVDNLMDSIRPLENRVDAKTERTCLDDIIHKSADVVAVGGRGSLEKHMRTLGFSQDCIGSYSIPQVDKLARYLFACKDIIRIVRQATYRTLFQNITLERLESFPEFTRPGTSKKCFVHAEIQQVFHHAQHPCEPHPRAIGCSKSTCYLCDLFLKQQGLYRVSHSQKRLYSQWTLPDVNWMTPEQRESFHGIVKYMTRHIRETEEDLSWQQPSGERPVRWSYGNESRAFTQVSSGSTVSDTNGRSAATSTKAPSIASSRGRGGREARDARDSSATTLTEHPRRARAESRNGRRDGAISRAASRTRSRARSTARERGVSKAPPCDRKVMRNRAMSKAPPPTRKSSRRLRDSSRPPPVRASSKAHSVPSTIKLRSIELPFHYDVKENEPAIALEIDTMSLIVEFPRRSAGRLYISRKDPSGVDKNDIDVENIPFDSDIKLDSGPRSSRHRFQLRHAPYTRLNIGFHWGSIT